MKFLETALKVILKKQSMLEKVLVIVLVEVEDILNAKPPIRYS